MNYLDSCVIVIEHFKNCIISMEYRDIRVIVMKYFDSDEMSEVCVLY